MFRGIPFETLHGVLADDIDGAFAFGGDAVGGFAIPVRGNEAVGFLEAEIRHGVEFALQKRALLVELDVAGGGTRGKLEMLPCEAKPFAVGDHGFQVAKASAEVDGFFNGQLSALPDVMMSFIDFFDLPQDMAGIGIWEIGMGLGEVAVRMKGLHGRHVLLNIIAGCAHLVKGQLSGDALLSWRTGAESTPARLRKGE